MVRIGYNRGNKFVQTMRYLTIIINAGVIFSFQFAYNTRNSGTLLKLVSLYIFRFFPGGTRGTIPFLNVVLPIERLNKGNYSFIQQSDTTVNLIPPLLRLQKGQIAVLPDLIRANLGIINKLEIII